MATRRSKLRVMPNIGPKISKTPSKPAEAKKPTASTNGAITKQSAEKPVLKEKTLPVLQDSVEMKNSEEPIGLMEKGSGMLKDVEMNKSPVKSETDKVKAGVKPDAGPVRAARNRLPKPKPNITSIRGAPRPKVSSSSNSPVKVFSPDRQAIKSPVKSPVAGLLAEDSSTQQSLPSTIEPCEQDENIPVSMETVDSVDSPAAGLVKPVPVKYDKSTSFKAEKNKPSRKQRTANMKQFPEDAPPDRQRMKMVDMIYWNPTSNPMKQSAEKVRKRTESITVDTSPNTSLIQTDGDTIDNNDESSTSNDAGLVPQVTIGPDGSMIINEQSLVVEAEQEKEALSPTEIVEEDDMFVNYNSFRNKTTTKSWLDNERHAQKREQPHSEHKKKKTARFYRALSALGTDFSLMSNLFPHRTRRELKNKFKREERFNRGLIDKAMSLRIPFSLDSFESIDSVLEKDKQEREARRKASQKRKKTDKQEESGESKSKKSKPIVDSDTDEEMSGKVSPKPQSKSKQSSPKTKTKAPKPKSVKEKKAKKKITKGDKEVDANTKKQQSKGIMNEIEEYRFESSDEDDQVPSRLPKLKKSANFTEFHNTAAQKLQESFGTRPPSEDDDEDDEEEDVDVMASDSDMEDNRNNVPNSEEIQDVSIENTIDDVMISESQEMTNGFSDNENVNGKEQTVEKSAERLIFEAGETVPEVPSQKEESDSNLTSIKEKPQSKSINVHKKGSEIISPKEQTHSDIVNSSSNIQNIETNSTSTSTISPPKEKSQPTRAPVRRLKKFQPNLNLTRKKTSVTSGSNKNPSKTVAVKKVEMTEKVTVTKKPMNITSRQETSSGNTMEKDQVQNDTAEVKSQITDKSQATNITGGTGSQASTILDINNTQALETQLSCDVVDINMGVVSVSDLNISYSEEEIVTSDQVVPVQNVEVLEKDNTNHFVLPANVFPNMPFTQDVDKMQMVLVPETKNGDTIYHVYMVPENNKSDKGQTTFGTSFDSNS